MHDLYHDADMLDGDKGHENHDKVARFVTKSSEMHEFNRTTDKVMSNITVTQSRAAERAKSELGPAFDEFEKIDRENKHPEGKVLLNALKKMRHIVLNCDKYNSTEACGDYRRIEIDLNDHMYYKIKDLNPEYVRIIKKIKYLLSTILEYNARELYKK